MFNKIPNSVVLIFGVIVAIGLLVAFASSLSGEKESWQVSYARELGLDIEQFQADLESEEVRARVEADVAEAENRGLNATPTVFVSGEQINFVADFYTELKAAIDEAIPNQSEPVLVEEFADFQCPACGTFYTTANQIKEEYGDKIIFEYRHFPLTSIHVHAYDAALAAEAAREQDAFQGMHDLLFENQDNITKPNFEG